MVSATVCGESPFGAMRRPKVKFPVSGSVMKMLYSTVKTQVGGKLTYVLVTMLTLTRLHTWVMPQTDTYSIT